MTTELTGMGWEANRPSGSLTPPPTWNILIKNLELNCVKLSHFSRFCGQNL